ncbi:MAG TPA: hypothetical protein PK297_14550 [Spirochaetota bacterium]|nr:hypothetical protein [Spirochaetota bacterium]
MNINSDNIIKDAQRLRGTTDEVRSKRSSSEQGASQPAAHQIEVTLDQMNINLRAHQQTVARLQLESIGLEQIQRSLEFITKSNPGDFEDIRRAIGEVQTATEATRFQQQHLIPQTLREALYSDLTASGKAQSALTLLQARRGEIETGLKDEFAQISRIQVSFENIQSVNMQLDGKAQSVVEDLSRQLLAQKQLVQSPMDPATVMNLLRA